MAIPPAWRDVWICSDPFGHIQATGLDEAGRKQYLYHERWQLRARLPRGRRLARRPLREVNGYLVLDRFRDGKTN